ncbi:oxytocin-neurophysin 1-like [Callorhinchus milii]|nr:oxytocin-neurophysin 1-like [Callorhinchus milii]ACN32396.1 vasotocin precursor [Callorhinchus milii]
MPELSLPLWLLCLLAFSSACYIQNCPRGGRRSAMEVTMRQCLPCGPDNRGRCFGPRICCGRDIGCYVGTAETLGCRGEDYLPSPCEPAGRPCGSERGKCASPGICCDDESCTVDSVCSENENEGIHFNVGRNLTHTDSAATNLLIRLMLLSKGNPKEVPGGIK